MDKEALAEYGIDLDKGMRNCMDNLPFFKKILSMFLQDTCFERSKAAYAAGNQKELFSCMHEMKGISGNAALTTLYAATVPLVELLRSGSGAPPEEVDRLFGAVAAAYNRALEGVKLFIAEP